MTTEDIPHYTIRKDSEFTWEIFSTVSGRTVSIGGKPKCGIPLDEADNEVDALNAGVLQADEDTHY